MTFGRGTSGLLHEVLEEVDCGDVSPSEETTNQGNFKGNSLTLSHSVRYVSEHLLAALATLVFALSAESTQFDVVNLDKWDYTGCTLEFDGANLGSPIRRYTRLEDKPTDKILSNGEDRLSELVVSRLRIRRTLNNIKSENS